MPGGLLKTLFGVRRRWFGWLYQRGASLAPCRPACRARGRRFPAWKLPCADLARYCCAIAAIPSRRFWAPPFRIRRCWY